MDDNRTAKTIVAEAGLFAALLVGWIGPDVVGFPTAITTAAALLLAFRSVLLPRPWGGRVLVATLALYPFLLIWIWVGFAEMGVLLVGTIIITSMLWYPPWLMRIVGSLLLALFLYVFLQAMLGPLWGAATALAIAAVAYWILPARAHRRVGFMVPSMVMLIFVTTVLMYEAPGSPFATEKQTTQQALEAQAAKFKIKDNALDFFVSYMDGLLTEGTMGLAVKVQGRTVEQLLLPALPVSMSLGLLALVIACLLGLTLGVRAGVKPNSFADYSSMGLAMVGISLPNFVIGACMLIVFSYWLGWLPVAGWGSYSHLMLPAITLALPYAAYIARLARNGTIEVMQQDFIRTARAKGLSERVVVLKHALKGAMLPVVSFLGPAAAGIFTGSFVVETLFAVPGMGQWFVKSALARDYSVVLGCAIIYFTIITLFNLLVDFAYAWLDPRVREEL